MNFTNRLELPEPLVAAIARPYYLKAGNISVTALIKSPRQRVLEQRHDAEISVDAADEIWRLMGQVIHGILHHANVDNHLSEERLAYPINGWQLTGMPDLLTPDGTLIDFKITSAWTYVFGGRAEWEKQLNLYALLYGHMGFKVEKLQITAIFRDWMRGQAERGNGYPESHALNIPIEKWEKGKTEKYLIERIELHQAGEKMTDDKLPPCSPEETWERPTTWAVMKEGRKTALRVLDTREEAEKMALGETKLSVVERPGRRVRCERYCRVSAFCQYAPKEEVNNELV